MDTRMDDSNRPEQVGDGLTEGWRGLPDQQGAGTAAGGELHHTEQVGLSERQAAHLEQGLGTDDQLTGQREHGMGFVPEGGEFLLHAERLVPGVERHEWARVKLTRRVVTEERTITVPVRREELVVEYLGDEPAPKAHPDTVRGSTDTSNSRVVEEFVLHQEVPRIELDTVGYERVKVVVDEQRSLVQLSDTVRREELDVDHDQHARLDADTQRLAGDQRTDRGI